MIHIFEPLATHTSPRFSARQLIEPMTSEPAPGSDIASAPTHSPEHSLGRYFSFCASVPLSQMLFTHRLEWAP